MANSTSQIVGLDQLNRKLAIMRAAFDGPPLQKLTKAALQPIAAQARRNARQGPSGKVRKGVNVFAGKKAVKFGAVAVCKVAWKYSGAIFEEWGTGERTSSREGGVMRIPAGKMGSMARVGNVGMGKRSARVWTAGAFGWMFRRTIAPMSGTRFFENAVDAKGAEALKIVSDGCSNIMLDATR